MRTHTLLSLALLGLLVGAICIHANDTHEGNDKEPETESVADDSEDETPKKEKTLDIEEEKDVMVLHDVNFARALSENAFLLVEFYAPWCGHCQKLEPEYAKAAKKLKDEGSKSHLGKVDGTENAGLTEEFKVEGYPTLKFFINGDRENPVDYTGKRTAKGILQWLKRQSSPAAESLETPETAAKFVDDHNIGIVGFFTNLESDAAKTYLEVAKDMMDAEFGLTSNPEVFKKYDVQSDSVVLFKKFDEGRADFALSDEGKLDKDKLASFITDNSMELVIKFTEATAEKIFGSNIRLHNLLFINSAEPSHVALLEDFKTVCKEFRGKMLGVEIDVPSTRATVLEYFGVTEDNIPTERIINTETGKKYSLSGAATEESLRELSKAVVDGTAQPYYKSEEIPEDWDKAPVKVLVGKNFDSVALDTTKNVFVEFYAPWCGHCKDMAPTWKKLAEKYADHDDILIAKMDSTVNEAASVTVKGFPTLQYYPAGGKEPVLYTGKKDLESLSNFLDDGGVLPEEPEVEPEGDDEGEDEGDEEEGDEDDNEILPNREEL
ncbi:protein disulfide-isomerase A2 [Genypterus blacodes]|uniref:protein disulfide-isomerase A2 n=1 Tax=Genypterus blacodes TaxID=154954 RepID=UPI003F770B41